MLLNLRKK
jgi:hypothetical protein